MALSQAEAEESKRRGKSPREDSATRLRMQASQLRMAAELVNSGDIGEDEPPRSAALALTTRQPVSSSDVALEKLDDLLEQVTQLNPNEVAIVNIDDLVAQVRNVVGL